MAALSLVKGSIDIPLSNQTLSDLIRDNSSTWSSNVALTSDGHNYTFSDLNNRSARVAQALIDIGINKSEHVGILVGNRVEYIDLFLGIGRIDRVAVALNPTDSVEDLCKAVEKRSCRAVFIATRCGSRRLNEHIEGLISRLKRQNGSKLEHIIQLDTAGIGSGDAGSTNGVETFEIFLARRDNESSVERFHLDEKSAQPHDVLTLQFTSGTTGEPKAAMLTHHGVINNAIHLSSRMNLGTADSLCCPAALFRTFGIVMGFLTAFSRGTRVVFPGQEFDAETTVRTIFEQKCTALLGEYRLFGALLETLKQQNKRVDTLRTCLAAGAVVPVSMREAMRTEMGIEDFVIAHGQTEIGPMVFITGTDDPKDTRSVGRIMPHRVAKVIANNGELVARSVKGELCVGGYGLLKGYYGNESKTREALHHDGDDAMWFHTGDEASIDEDGYCYYGGRLDDIITLRDGSRIYPTEIEERLLEFDGITEAAVVPVKTGSGQAEEGSLIGAFLVFSKSSGSERPQIPDVQQWVEQSLGAQKAPHHIFWAGDPGVGDNLPKTYNGKPQKRKMSEMGSKLLQSE